MDRSLSLVISFKSTGLGLHSRWLLVATSVALLLSGPTAVLGAGKDAPTRGKKGVKINYDVKSLHNDGQYDLENGAEVVWAFEKSDKFPQTGINSGCRDQYVAGLSHLYANDVNQRFGELYYTQEEPSFDWLGNSTTGEMIHANKFLGMTVSEGDPLFAATVDGIAFLQESLGGHPSLLVGKHLVDLAAKDRQKFYENPKVTAVKTGADLDKAWEAHGNTPMIVTVNAYTRMFTGIPTEELRKMIAEQSQDSVDNVRIPFGGHVVVISARRENPNGKGKTSSYEYKMLNSWGDDPDGTPRSGWVGADQMVSAMNYVDKTGVEDESYEPSRAISKGALPVPKKNVFGHYSRKGFGLKLVPTTQLVKYTHSGGHAAVVSAVEDEAAVRGGSSKSQADELKKRIAESSEGFTSAQRELIEGSVDQILNNKNYKGEPRQYELSEKEKAGVLKQANRLIKDTKAILGQKLGKDDRNRALIAMLHDTANPEHINQGMHNTCNVTTCMKIEAFMRPAAQAKRFVDMYTNANGDQTVSLPL